MNKPQGNKVTMTALECAQLTTDYASRIGELVLERTGCVIDIFGFEDILNAYAQQRCAGLWQPIETAPKDGTEVIICCMGLAGLIVSPCTASWEKSRGREGWKPTHEGAPIIESQSDYDTFYKGHMPASHWMPLPPPPALAQFNKSSNDNGEKVDV